MMWLLIATKRGVCMRCGVEYFTGDPVGVISSHADGVVTRSILHPQCWLEQGLITIGHREPPDEQLAELRNARNLTIHHWAQLSYMERQARKKLSGEKLAQSLTKIMQSKNELRARMTLLGGVPKSWREE